MWNYDLLVSAFAALAHTTTKPCRYATTDSEDALPSPFDTSASMVNSIKLGPIRRPDAVQLDESRKTMIPVACTLLERGLLRPSEHTTEAQDNDGIIQAWDVQQTGRKGSTKVIVSVGI